MTQPPDDENPYASVSDVLGEALSDRIKNRYAKVAKSEAIFHGIVDLWRIYHDLPLNDEIIALVNAFVREPVDALPGGLAYAAINDLLAANLAEQLITPQQARKLRQVLFGRNDLHGVFRADLYNPRDGVVDNPVFRMVHLGGCFPGIYQYLRLQREAGAKSPDYAMWGKECYIPRGLVAAVLLETFRGFVVALDFPFSEACARMNREKFARLSSFTAYQLAQFAPWQVCPVVLKFDPLLVNMLADTEATQKIPREILKQLPYWSVCVELPGITAEDRRIDYLMLSINHDQYKDPQGDPGGLLKLVATPFGELKGATELSMTYPLEYATLSETQEVRRQQMPPDAPEPAILDRVGRLSTRILTLAVQTALYIASRKPDYDADAAVKTLGRHAVESRQKPAADKLPHEFTVGQKLSATLRQWEKHHGAMYVTGTERTVSPHWRKAHWHTYRCGKGRAEVISHFLPPIPINLAVADQLPVMERNVDEHAIRPEEELGLLDDAFFVPGNDDPDAPRH